ncbi:Short-chain dehydrogenase/reductase SDR [Penicillium expansum]|nr:Short-chain dehydrogenase/reductase SDR [Penicillium expansum]
MSVDVEVNDAKALSIRTSAKPAALKVRRLQDKSKNVKKGANSGIGLATAKVLAQAPQGFHVILACRSLEKGTQALDELKQEGIATGNVSTVHLDVTDETSVRAAANTVQERFGQLDVLVNNAGVASRHPDIKTRLQLCMDTNVIGPAVKSAAFRSLLLQSPNPYSIYGPSNGEAYRASKSALNMIMIQDWVESRDTPLKVFAVCPGFVRSSLRGTSEEERSGWGNASDPSISGNTILGILEGRRDAEVGRLIHKDGSFPW